MKNLEEEMKKLLIILALGAAVVPFLANSGSPFDIPYEINYQGMLTDNEGTPVSDGNYDILFKIYNHPSNGAMQWQELQEDVLVQEGIFNVVLGSVNPINLSFYEVERYWLDITVEGEHMPSRINFTSVPFAYRAETADFAHFAAGVTEDYSDDRYVNVSGPDSVRGNSSSYMLRVKNYGSGDGIYLYTPTSGSGDGIYIDSAGNYGIYITDTGDDAIKIDDGQARGIEITDIGNDGIYLDDIGDQGIYMEDVANEGIWLNDIEGVGLYVNDAGASAVYVKLANYGLYVDSVKTGGDGVWVDYGSDDGLYVRRAGDDGLYINNAGGDGMYVYHADRYGLYIYDSDDDGIRIASADGAGIEAHGGYRGGDFYSGNSSYAGVAARSYNGLSGNIGLAVYGYATATGGFGKSVAGASGDVPAFSVCSPDVELIISGTGTLVNGQAQIAFEPEFQEAISSEIPVKLVLTAQGAPSGLLYVASKSNQGFSVERLEIPDLAMKSDDIAFDWIAIARQKGYEQRPQIVMGEEDSDAEQLSYEEEIRAEELKHQEELERDALFRQQMREKQAQKEAETEEEEREE
jgi:hypothetical protein